MRNAPPLHPLTIRAMAGTNHSLALLPEAGAVRPLCPTRRVAMASPLRAWSGRHFAPTAAAHKKEKKDMPRTGRGWTMRKHPRWCGRAEHPPHRRTAHPCIAWARPPLAERSPRPRSCTTPPPARPVRVTCILLGCGLSPRIQRGLRAVGDGAIGAVAASTPDSDFPAAVRGPRRHPGTPLPPFFRRPAEHAAADGGPPGTFVPAGALVFPGPRRYHRPGLPASPATPPTRRRPRSRPPAVSDGD